MAKFPKFWFDGEMFYGWVYTTEEVTTKLFNNYLGIINPDTLLDNTWSNPSVKYPFFGLTEECCGEKSLREFFKENGIEITVPKYPEFEDMVAFLRQEGFQQSMVGHTWTKKYDDDTKAIVSLTEFNKTPINAGYSNLRPIGWVHKLDGIDDEFELIKSIERLKDWLIDIEICSSDYHPHKQ